MIGEHPGTGDVQALRCGEEDHRVRLAKLEEMLGTPLLRRNRTTHGLWFCIDRAFTRRGRETSRINPDSAP